MKRLSGRQHGAISCGAIVSNGFRSDARAANNDLRYRRQGCHETWVAALYDINRLGPKHKNGQKGNNAAARESKRAEIGSTAFERVCAQRPTIAKKHNAPLDLRRENRAL